MHKGSIMLERSELFQNSFEDVHSDQYMNLTAFFKYWYRYFDYDMFMYIRTTVQKTSSTSASQTKTIQTLNSWFLKIFRTSVNRSEIWDAIAKLRINYFSK